jgi:hypothetical protein
MQADDGEPLNRTIRLNKTKGTVYQLLKDISEQSGYLFIYDNSVVDNDKKMKIHKGDYPLREAIYLVTGNPLLEIRLVGNHILLKTPGKIRETETAGTDAPAPEANDSHFTVRGRLLDQQNDEPILYASVSIINTTTGTVTNRNGEFQLIIPDSLRSSSVRFSHIGYESHEIESGLLAGQDISFRLEPTTFALQEVEVRAVNAKQLINEMLQRKEVNYPLEPAYLTAFYREGIEHRKQNIDLTEAVLQLYKTGYGSNPGNDQVKLIKKRRIVNHLENDTIFPKMKSGINSCLILDVMKELPDFMDPADDSYFAFYKDMTSIDNRSVYIITFVQNQYIKEPLYTGDLYIEADSKALAEARFEVNPRLIDKATNLFIDRKTAGLKLSLLEAKYIVSYKPDDDGRYHINHVRGDITFKVKKKGRLFSSTLHFWFEMVTCKTDTENVKPFPRNERLSPTKIFAEAKHGYDKNFWAHFNIILPEDKLKEMIIHNLNEVTEE